MKLTINGAPRTKKNSQRIIRAGGRMIPIPSAAYKQYESDCVSQIPYDKRVKIDYPINLKCTFFMPTHRRVDLVNLLEAICDILVVAGVISDDNCTIVAAHDGCRVLYDKANPRAEIEIEELKTEQNCL